jgi:hypothetical protein
VPAAVLLNPESWPSESASGKTALLRKNRTAQYKVDTRVQTEAIPLSDTKTHSVVLIQ